MSGVFGRRALLELLVLACALVAAVMIAARPATAADTIAVYVDQARIVKMPERTATIVVGNPLIADISLLAGGIMVVTGKGYGATNLVVLDRGGNVLREWLVQVRGPGDEVVVVYRSMERETLTCAPECQPRITLGDSPNFFTPTLTQTGTRNGQAQGAGVPAGPPK